MGWCWWGLPPYLLGSSAQCVCPKLLIFVLLMDLASHVKVRAQERTPLLAVDRDDFFLILHPASAQKYIKYSRYISSDKKYNVIHCIIKYSIRDLYSVLLLKKSFLGQNKDIRFITIISDPSEPGGEALLNYGSMGSTTCVDAS